MVDFEKSIESIIPAAHRTKARKMFVRDSLDGGSTLLGLVYEIINSKAACAAIAAVVIAWIKSRNGKKVIIKKDGVRIEASNLTQQELESILERGSKVVIDTEKTSD